MNGDRGTEPGAVEMTARQIDAFLGRGGTGVLSLARDDEPYATPVSYGYDAGSGQFYFRLGLDGGLREDAGGAEEGGEDAEGDGVDRGDEEGGGEGGGKRDFLRPDARARLVAYGPVDGGWASVIAAGTLEPVDDGELTVETANALREAELPLLEIWGDELDSIEFHVYRLVVEELTGRTTATS